MATHRRGNAARRAVAVAIRARWRRCLGIQPCDYLINQRHGVRFQNALRPVSRFVRCDGAETQYKPVRSMEESDVTDTTWSA